MSRLAACRKLERTRQYDAVLPLSPCAQPCVSPHCKRDMSFHQLKNSLGLASPSVVRSAATPLAVPPSPNTLPCSWASHSLVYLNARVRRLRQRTTRSRRAGQRGAARVGEAGCRGRCACGCRVCGGRGGSPRADGSAASRKSRFAQRCSRRLAPSAARAIEPRRRGARVCSRPPEQVRRGCPSWPVMQLSAARLLRCSRRAYGRRTRPHRWSCRQRVRQTSS